MVPSFSLAWRSPVVYPTNCLNFQKRPWCTSNETSTSSKYRPGEGFSRPNPARLWGYLDSSSVRNRERVLSIQDLRDTCAVARGRTLLERLIDRISILISWIDRFASWHCSLGHQAKNYHEDSALLVRDLTSIGPGFSRIKLIIWIPKGWRRKFTIIHNSWVKIWFRVALQICFR